MTRKESDIAAMFNAISPRYDFLNRLLSMSQDQRWRKAMVERIPERHGGVFVDVATGTGDVILAAQKKRPEYARFIGTDIAVRMLELAEKKVAGSALFEFKTMSAESMDMPTRSVDCISIAFGLRNVIEPDQAIREFFRILRPSSRLMILEFFQPSSGPMSRLFQFYFNSILPKIGALFSQKSAYEYLPDSVSRFYSVDELCVRLREAGFVIHEKRSFLFGACCLVVADKIDHFEESDDE
jgi:demethylmenaquinone methyltransferase / 2-methoxy-6-polyprenyl-1,4-benzoquinol methylase